MLRVRMRLPRRRRRWWVGGRAGGRKQALSGDSMAAANAQVSKVVIVLRRW